MTKNIITLEEINAKTLFVVEFDDGHRVVCHKDEVKQYTELYDDISDIDYLSVENQPEELRDFYTKFNEYRRSHREYIKRGDYYNDVYLVEAQSEEKDEQKPKRVWTEDEIKNLVQTNDKVLYGALKNLYDCQTYDEKTNEKTSHANGAGFNAMDAKVLTSIAEFLLKNGFLTAKQKELVRKKLVKYTRQLTRLANA